MRFLIDLPNQRVEIADTDIVTPTDVIRALTDSVGCPFVVHEPRAVSPEAFRALPWSFLEEHNLLPLAVTDGRLTIAVDQFLDVYLISEISRRFGGPVEVLAAEPNNIREVRDTVQGESTKGAPPRLGSVSYPVIMLVLCLALPAHHAFSVDARGCPVLFLARACPSAHRGSPRKRAEGTMDSIPCRVAPSAGRGAARASAIWPRRERRAGKRRRHGVRNRPHRPVRFRQLPPPRGMSGFLGTGTRNTLSRKGSMPNSPVCPLTNQTRPRGRTNSWPTTDRGIERGPPGDH